MPETVFERLAPPEALVTASLAGSRLACFWTEDAGPVDPAEPLRGERDADLAVVGGGYTGLWTAVRAKERDPDRRVVLLEGARVGWAASSRNGGFCAASLTHGAENGRSRWPSEMGTLDRLGRENLDAIESTVARYRLNAEFERTGAFTVAVEPHQVDWLRSGAEEGDGRFLDAAAMRAEVASPTYLAGLAEDGDAMLHPARLAHELARLARELGVEIHEATPVRGLSDEGSGRVRLVTDHGAVRAACVALGTNAFPSLLRRHRLLTVPVYDYVIATEPLSAAQKLAVGWASRRGIGDAGNQFHYYRLTRDDRVVFGGYDAIYHPGRRVDSAYEDRDASYRRLTAHLLTTFPQLEGIRVTHRWAGAIDTSTRFCAFHALTHGGRVAHSAGFTGLGVAATRFAADVMLDQLSGERTERTELELVRRLPVPFPPEPLAAFGINLTRWSLDRADHRQGRRNLWLRGLDRLGLGFDS
jgi:glycine/D-amino acid oxidase-like deaminating enzyme